MFRKFIVFFEKYILVLLVLFVLVLVISQLGIYRESTREIFTKISEYEGVNLNEIDKMFNRGKLSLKLKGIKPNKKIKVLVNGYESYDFNKGEITIDIGNNSVIEIDGTKIKETFYIEISDISNNIKNKCLGKEYEIDNKIVLVDRVFLK